ncbi:MAG: hypothetical protein WCE21_00840 [Candidatus Babeliales bacterium]
MKHLLLLLLIIHPVCVQAERLLVNRVAAVVHGPERSRIFTQLEYKRRGIDGRMRKLDDLISEELIFQDALRVKMPIDDTVVKAHLRRVLQGFGLKPGDEETIFAQEGYTYAEGFEQFRLMYAVNAMTEHQIMQNLLITEDEVVAYYNAHPIVKEPAFLLETASMPFIDTTEREELKRQVTAYVEGGDRLSVEWSAGYWVKKSELVADLATLPSLDIGDILTVDGPRTLYLYRLLNKKAERCVPLAKRYKKIAEILRKPKFEQLLSEYRTKLLDGATIVYMQ